MCKVCVATTAICYYHNQLKWLFETKYFRFCISTKIYLAQDKHESFCLTDNRIQNRIHHAVILWREFGWWSLKSNCDQTQTHGQSQTQPFEDSHLAAVSGVASKAVCVRVLNPYTISLIYLAVYRDIPSNYVYSAIFDIDSPTNGNIWDFILRQPIPNYLKA